VIAAGSGFAVTPANWVMIAGRTAQFVAYLVPAAGGCIPIGALFTWELDPFGALLGYLNRTAGATGEFTAFPYASGRVTINVSATGYEDCPGGIGLLLATQQVEVTVVPPLLTGELRGIPEVASPGSIVTLSSSIDGGLPPYVLTVDFGDGTGTTLARATPGPVEFLHGYARGTYTPVLHVNDSLGEAEANPPAAPIVITPSLDLAIASSGSHAEVGVPFELSAAVANGIGESVVRWHDSHGASAEGAVWWLNLTASGPDTVTADATDARGDTASASLYLMGMDALNVTVRSAPTELDLGQPAALTIDLTGGLPPFQLSAAALPVGSGFELPGVTQRTVQGALLPGATGTFWVEVAATDALGDHLVTTVDAGTVSRRPSLSVNLTDPFLEVGVPAGVVGIVEGGAPPYSWSIATTGTIEGGTPLRGALAGPGPFAWVGSFATRGSTIVEVTVADGTGSIVSWNATVVVHPSLAVSVAPLDGSATAGSSLPLTAVVQGGVGPYNLSFTLSDGEQHLDNLSAPGALAWMAHPLLAGTVRVELTATDRAGATLAAWTNVTVAPAANATPPPPLAPPASPAPTPAPPPAPGTGGVLAAFASALGAALGVGMMVTVGWFLFRARRRGAPRDSSDEGLAASRAVRALIQENDGIDHDTLLLLAEEEQLRPAAVDAALRRWEGSGRVRRSPGEDGVDVYRWHRVPPRSDAVRPSPSHDGAEDA
jgi:hypothetical protein